MIRFEINMDSLSAFPLEVAQMKHQLLPTSQLVVKILFRTQLQISKIWCLKYFWSRYLESHRSIDHWLLIKTDRPFVCWIAILSDRDLAPSDFIAVVLINDYEYLLIVSHLLSTTQSFLCFSCNQTVGFHVNTWRRTAVKCINDILVTIWEASSIKYQKEMRMCADYYEMLLDSSAKISLKVSLIIDFLLYPVASPLHDFLSIDKKLQHSFQVKLQNSFQIRTYLLQTLTLWCWLFFQVCSSACGPFLYSTSMTEPFANFAF